LFGFDHPKILKSRKIKTKQIIMKNLKTLDRKELKNVLGGATLACEAPVDGGCSKPGYIFCSNPYCCYPPNRPFICLD